jgi:Domain of unknown function (DUF1707)
MPEPHQRAADVDREAVATALGEHMAAGRLTVAEYDERLARAYTAKTYGELAELTSDLPGPAPRHVPAPASTTPAPTPPARNGAGTSAWEQHDSWRAWLGTGVIVVAIWAITSIASGAFLYFWPIWVIGPWGAVLLAQRITGGGEKPGPDRRRLDS